MAIFVVLATVAGIVIVAITTSGNEDLESSGRTDVGVPCETWEYLSIAHQAAGRGGPDGAGGVYSSNIGCFAPCYWRNLNISSDFSPNFPASRIILGVLSGGAEDTGVQNTLTFDPSNRPPRTSEIRFGVVYRQDDQASDFIPSSRPANNPNGTDPIIVMGTVNRIRSPEVINGRRANTDGITPIGAYTHKPAWAVRGATQVELQVRADPGNKTCTIVDVTNDEIVCSSEDDDCYDRQYPVCRLSATCQ